LNEDQLKIISAIEKDATHIDDIVETTGLGTAKVLAQLTVLEIKGFIRREAGRRVTLKITKK
jgi:predicted Rossmann fold nucleotide-binding protein DprA/Smf involved in DNA uptake